MPTGIYKRIKPAWNKGKTGNESTNWKGGKPSCFCGKVLSLRRYSVCANHKIITDITRKNMSKAQEGRKQTKKQIDRLKEVNTGNTYSKGIVRSDDFKKRVSEALKGSNSYRWISDRSKVISRHKDVLSRPQYNEWRKNIFSRDNWKCKISNNDCKGQLEAHHILSWRDYKELRYEVNNGITLCQFHHPRKRAEETRLSPYFQGLIIQTK